MRFRAAIWVGALLAACALALAACADDAQQQAEQGAAAQPQAAAAAEPQAAAPAQAAQQQEAETAPQSGSTAQSAQQSAEPTEQAAAQQAEPPEEGEPPPADAGAAVQLDAIQALYNRWVANLTSFVLQFDVAIGVSGQPMSEQTITMQVQLEPLAVHYRTQLPAFEGMADDGAQTDAADAQAAGPPTAPVTDFLLIEDSVYISLPEAGGWVRAPLDQNAEAALTDIFGSGGDDLDGAFLGRAALFCAELTGAAVTEGEFDGRAAWVVVCEADAAAFEAVLAALAAAGHAAPQVSGAPLGAEGFQVESMTATVWIDQQEGAALGHESTAAVRREDAAAADNSIDGFTATSVGRTLSWNQPIDLPAPEPLLEDPEADVYE